MAPQTALYFYLIGDLYIVRKKNWKMSFFFNQDVGDIPVDGFLIQILLLANFFVAKTNFIAKLDS